MSDWVVEVVETLGYAGIFALMVLECLFPPIPSEAILPFAGFAVGEGSLSFPLAVLAATAGSVTGNLMLYLGARRGGRPLADRHGHRVGATPERLDLLDAWMTRFGSITVLGCRAVPLARSAVSVPAGLGRFPIGRFLVLTAIGSGIWNTALIGLGWALDDSWHRVEERMGPISIVVVAAIVCIGILLLLNARRTAPRSSGGTPRS